MTDLVFNPNFVSCVTWHSGSDSSEHQFHHLRNEDGSIKVEGSL